MIKDVEQLDEEQQSGVMLFMLSKMEYNGVKNDWNI